MNEWVSECATAHDQTKQNRQPKKRLKIPFNGNARYIIAFDFIWITFVTAISIVGLFIFFDSVQFALLSFSVYTQQCTCCAAFVALLCSLTTCALGGNPKDAHFHSTYTECVQDATCIQSIDYVELKLL